MNNKRFIFPALIVIGLLLAGLIGYKLGFREVSVVSEKTVDVEATLPSLAPAPGQEAVSTKKPVSKIVIPSDWKEFKATDPQFKFTTTMSLPSGYKFWFSGSEFTIADNGSTELWDYSTSISFDWDNNKQVNSYDGSSRRAWYQDYLTNRQKDFNYKDKILNFTEVPIEGTSYIDVLVEIPIFNDQGSYSGTTRNVHRYLYVQNNVMNMISPLTEYAFKSELHSKMGQVLSSLKINLEN